MLASPSRSLWSLHGGTSKQIGANHPLFVVQYEPKYKLALDTCSKDGISAQPCFRLSVPYIDPISPRRLSKVTREYLSKSYPVTCCVRLRSICPCISRHASLATGEDRMHRAEAAHYGQHSMARHDEFEGSDIDTSTHGGHLSREHRINDDKRDQKTPFQRPSRTPANYSSNHPAHETKEKFERQKKKG